MPALAQAGPTKESKVNYTRKQLESGEGRYTDRHTVIFQRGGEDAFVTGRPEDRPGPGYHVAGGCSPSGEIEWCDLR